MRTAGVVEGEVASEAGGGGRGGTSLQVHVTNGGSAAVGAPRLVLACEESLCVEVPPGLAKNKHTGDYLMYMDADSSVADSAQAFPGALVWRLDSLLPAGAGAPQLAPGETSGSRDIAISIHSGVHRFAFTLWATAAAVGGAVPATAPDSEPQRLYDPANRTSDARWPGVPFMRGIILMRFQAGAAPAKRQAAVDSVQGEVSRRPHPSRRSARQLEVHLVTVGRARSYLSRSEVIPSDPPSPPFSPAHNSPPAKCRPPALRSSRTSPDRSPQRHTTSR